jgi:hypothetical protein
LPVRYGTRADDDDAVAQVLAERRPQLADALERTRGAVELAVRVVQAAARAAAPEPPASGADYLRSKARHDAAADDIHSPLASLARASRQHPGRAPGELVRAAYLVDRDAVSSFVDRVAELQKAKPELRLLCTGPWPPYSFTSA